MKNLKKLVKKRIENNSSYQSKKRFIKIGVVAFLVIAALVILSALVQSFRVENDKLFKDKELMKNEYKY